MAKNKMDPEPSKDPNELFVHRPDPPRDLNADEATEWREMVASMPPLLRRIALSEVGPVVQDHGRIETYQPIDRGLQQAEENQHPRIYKTAERAVEGVGHDHAADALNAADAPDRLPSRLSQATPRTRASFTF